MQSLDQIWESVLRKFTEIYPQSVYAIWFKDTKLLYLDGERAVVSVNSDFKAKIIKARYISAFVDTLCEIIGFDPQVEIISVEHEQFDLDAYLVSLGTKPEEHPVPPFELPADDTIGTFIPYNHEYTFDNFIVGSSNKLAYAACTAVAKRSESMTYNPLFIHGESGLGKTHLLYAIINSMKQDYPGLTIVYVKGDDFTNELVSAIASESTLAFRNKYRKADVLLIDDIQFIAGKESTQEEFFHTFNALYEDHKQIILAADRPPKDMKTLEDRLRSRFEWGLIVDVQLPDYELRLAILKNKSKMVGVHIPMPVLQFLAESLRSNIRQLEGAIKKIAAQSFLSGMPVTEDMAKSCIAELTSSSEPVAQTVERIISKVAENYGLTSADLKSQKRTREIANARHVAIYIIRTITNMSLPAIGKIFDRDHSTVLASVSVVEKEMKKTPLYEVEVRDLIKSIREG